MRTHSSILAWEIPWTEEPGGLTLSHFVVVCHAHLGSFTHLYGLYIKVMHYFKKADDNTGVTFLKCSVD